MAYSHGVVLDGGVRLAIGGLYPRQRGSLNLA